MRRLRLGAGAAALGAAALLALATGCKRQDLREAAAAACTAVADGASERPGSAGGAGAAAAVSGGDRPVSSRVRTPWSLAAPGGVVAPGAVLAAESVAYVVSRGEETRRADDEEVHFKQIGQLHALDLASGQERWRTPLEGLLVRRPIVDGDSIYLTGDSYCNLRHRAGEGCSALCERKSRVVVYAVARKDGKVRWAKPQEDSVSLGFVAAGRVYLAARDRARVLDAATGEPAGWFAAGELTPSLPAPGEPGAAGPTRPALLVHDADPVRDGAVVYRASDGSRWQPAGDRPALGRINVSPLVGRAAIYLPTDVGELFALDLAGKLLWKRDGLPVNLYRPAEDGGRVFVAGEKIDVLALDTKSGQLRWQARMATRVSGPLVAASGRVYVPTLKELVVLNAITGAPKTALPLASLDGATPTLAPLADRTWLLLGTSQPEGLAVRPVE